MAEPQPSDVHEGSSVDPTTSDTLPKDAAKAAAALSTLDANGDGTEKTGGDAEALGKAMKDLDLKNKLAAAAAKKVKIEAADVNLLVDQLELNKVKATELLRQHGGDAVKAMTAYVTALS